MTAANATSSSLSNGSGAAAVLAAGFGAFALGLFALLADKIGAIKTWTNFSNPTGPLSGVTTMAIVVWVAAWIVLHIWWRGRDVRLALVCHTALVLLALGMLLTFPPFADLF